MTPAEIEALAARVEALKEALRACRRAVARHSPVTGRDVREIVDHALAKDRTDG